MTRLFGPCDSVARFLLGYGKVRVQAVYALQLRLYFRWLLDMGISQSPDALIVDNLRCQFESKPEDVSTKRKHRAWIEEYVNERMKGRSHMYRVMAASILSSFYRKNDSPLFGQIQIVEYEEQARAKALMAEDIRKVLKSLPVHVRTPLLLVWQSSCEINRILALRWKDVIDGLTKGEHPLKVEFFGRKGHKRL